MPVEPSVLFFELCETARLSLHEHFVIQVCALAQYAQYDFGRTQSINRNMCITKLHGCMLHTRTKY